MYWKGDKVVEWLVGFIEFEYWVEGFLFKFLLGMEIKWGRYGFMGDWERFRKFWRYDYMV